MTLGEATDLEVTVDGENIVGPVTVEQVRRGVESGRVPRSAYARQAGTEQWMPLDQVLAAAPPPSAGATPAPPSRPQLASDALADLAQPAGEGRREKPAIAFHNTSGTDVLDPMLMRARARVGSTLKEKWRLDVLLGVGGMAAVYAATHRNGSRAAVKLLHTELSANSLVRQRFLREGYVANAVAHEGAVRVLDDDTADDGSLYLVTELLDGETLEERRLRFGGRLDEDEVLSIADQLLDALAAAHARGVVHRDLKPENLFLTRDGRLKVLDFGIARLRELSSASNATKTGSTMGTPAYMAPEHARGLWDEVDARTDLWAVGATMFTLLTGKLVHEGCRTPNEQLVAAITKPAPPLVSIASGIAKSVAHVVDRALAYDKNARWPDAQTMQEGVRRAYHDRHGAPITTAPKLTVPGSVPNRTLPSADAPYVPPYRQPTTGQPVASASGAMPQVQRVPVAALVFGGAVVLGVIVASVVIVVALTRPAPSPATVSSVASPPAVASAPPAAASTNGPPQAASSPGATTTPPAPTATGRPQPKPTPTASAAPAATARPRCKRDQNNRIIWTDDCEP